MRVVPIGRLVIGDTARWRRCSWIIARSYVQPSSASTGSSIRSMLSGHVSHSSMFSAAGPEDVADMELPWLAGTASLNSDSCSTTASRVGLRWCWECTHCNARPIMRVAFSMFQLPAPGRRSSMSISSPSARASTISLTTPVASVRPNSTSRRVTPTLYTSLAARYTPVLRYCRSMKPKLPTTLLCVESREPPSGASLASPTSPSLAMPLWDSRMLEGLKSRCIMAGELLCRKSSPTHASYIMRSRTFHATSPSLSRSSRVPPSSSSITIACRSSHAA
mmetsp:Transcript_2120/g.5313  ORF Transcript_2120/g.5313 Transcript_2120/m.5313 type:complete len:278 (+) Transcript_2120:607-1440(+)